MNGLIYVCIGLTLDPLSSLPNNTAAGVVMAIVIAVCIHVQIRHVLFSLCKMVIPSYLPKWKYSYHVNYVIQLFQRLICH